MQPLFLPLILLAVCCFGCKKITTERPHCDDETIVIPQETSYLSTPLVIPTRIIEEKLNSCLGQYIVNDMDFNNLNLEGKKDKLKLQVTRLDNIQVSWKDNVATCTAPLKVVLERQILGNKVLPLKESVSVKSEFSLQLVFEITLNIGEDWRLLSETKFRSLEWLSEAKTKNGLIDFEKDGGTETTPEYAADTGKYGRYNSQQNPLGQDDDKDLGENPKAHHHQPSGRIGLAENPPASF
jgi:Domain of unknown function (DUF4403)